MAKSPNDQHTQNALHAGRQIIPQRGAGKALEHTCVPRGPDLKTNPMKPLAMRNPPRSHLTLKLLLQANQPLVKLTQKTDFATAPNKRPNVDTTICHI